MQKPRALSPGDRIAIVAPARTFKREEFDEGVAELRRLGVEPAYAGVIAVRGGYGSAQVLPLLDHDLARRAAKPFVGYSDLTAVLTFLTVHCDLVAFHGPMLAGRLARGSQGYDRASLLMAVSRRGPLGG